jgi:hypothetical protein
MSTLPNILPAANTDSFSDGGVITYSGKPEKTGEPFDRLMARALSPASNEANPVVERNQMTKNTAPDLQKSRAQTDADSSPQQTKKSKSGAQISGKAPVKKSGGDSDASTNSTTLSDINVAAINSENVLIQRLAPATVIADPKIELKAEAMTTGNAEEVLAVLPELKNQGQSAVKANSIGQAGGHGKIAAAVEALTVEKTNSTDSKISGPTAANSQTPSTAKGVGTDLTAPKLAEKSFVQSPQPEFSPGPGLSAKSAPQKQPEVNGTSVAQQDVPMKKMEKTDKITSSAGKILPGAAVSVARENNLPSRENFSAAALSRAGQMAANVTANSSASNNANDAAPVSADAANAIVSGNTAEVRSRALERAQDIIVLHADRLSESGNASLQVVIKPGAGTQLSLELRQRGDGVEAQAVLQRGDFNHLNQQWPALQQQLEQRGIRLAPLVSDGNFVNSDNPNTFQNTKNQSAESDLIPALAEVAPIGSFAPTATRAGTHRGWESWA